MIALRIIIFSILIGITIYLCVKYAPVVGKEVINVWNKLTGNTKRK